MFECRKCGKKCEKRTEHLVHISVCNRYPSLDTGSDSSDFVDDSDADPDWQLEESEAYENPCSSPITDEQLSVATFAEDNLMNWPSHQQTPVAKDVQEIQDVTKDHPNTDAAEQVEVEQAPNDYICLETDTGMENNDATNRLTGTILKSKRNWCKYCSTLQTKLGRHIAAKHKDIEEVQMYIKAENINKIVQKKQRREICKSIANKSNLIYNNLVVNKDISGNPIPVRVSKLNKENLDLTTHKICSACSGLFSKRYFSKHKSHCIGINNQTVSEVPINSLPLEPKLDKQFGILHSKVLNKMNKDKVYKVIINDKLILEFGRRFLKAHMDNHQRNYVGSKMRSVADLFLRMKKLDPNICSFKDCIQPDNFNTLCSAVQQWSQYNEENGICGVGSVPRRICKSLKICSYILVSESFRSKTMSDDEQSKIKINHEKFSSLMANDWALEVNSAGDKSLKVTKMSNEDKMPEEQDLITFFENMTSIIERKTNQLLTTEQLGPNDYDNLAKSTLAYLIAFNSRRPKEVALATIKQYSRLQISQGSNDDGEKLAVFTVPATKNDVKVPVIVPQIAQQAIQILLKFRPILNVQGDLIFGKKDGTPFNGSQTLNDFKKEMSLIKPGDFTANGIRHYWATKSQTKPEIKKHMPKFLGHTLATHQKFYELPSNDVNLNIIGPMILQHTQTKYNSKVSNDFQTSPVKLHSTSEHEVQMEQSNTNDSDKIQITPPKSSFTDSSSVNSTPSPLPIQKRQKWITPERKELFQNLPQTILGLEPAGRGKIKEVWEKSKIIRKRHNLQMTRIEVSKYFTKKKKITTPEKEKFLN